MQILFVHNNAFQLFIKTVFLLLLSIITIDSSSLLKPVESFGQFMELDSDALRNLEIFSNNNDNTEEGMMSMTFAI